VRPGFVIRLDHVFHWRLNVTWTNSRCRYWVTFPTFSFFEGVADATKRFLVSKT